jgi:hypothetical protein
MGFESGKVAILVKVKSGIRTFDKMLTMCIVHPVIKVNQTTSTRLAWKIMKLKVVFTLARASKVLPRREPLANLDFEACCFEPRNRTGPNTTHGPSTHSRY